MTKSEAARKAYEVTHQKQETSSSMQPETAESSRHDYTLEELLQGLGTKGEAKLMKRSARTRKKHVL